LPSGFAHQVKEWRIQSDGISNALATARKHHHGHDRHDGQIGEQLSGDTRWKCQMANSAVALPAMIEVMAKPARRQQEFSREKLAGIALAVAVSSSA